MAAASAAAASAEKSGSPGAIESAQTDSGGVPLAPVLARYPEVGLRYNAEKVRDYSAEQDLLGYTFDWNVLRGWLPRYHALAQAVRSLERRMWAQPREVERLVGRFTHWILLHRAALSIFNAVYAFATKVGERRARLWPSVLRELQRVLAVLPLVRSDLARPLCAPSCTQGRYRTLSWRRSVGGFAAS